LLTVHGISRRRFLTWASATAALLMLPDAFRPRLARAAELLNRIPVIWLEGQDCAGNTEALLRASAPTIDELLFQTISLEYHETLMSAAGMQAEERKRQAAKDHAGKYILVIEGSIPNGLDGAYCTIGPQARPFIEEVKELAGGAALVIAAGACAFYGGIPIASPNPTDAVGVSSVVSGKPIVNIPACPLNPANLMGTILHFAMTGQPPAPGQPAPASVRLRVPHPRQLRAARPLRRRRVRREVGRRVGAQQLLPLPDGLQGSDDVQQLLDQEAVLNLATFDRRRRFDTSRPDPLNAWMFVLLHLLAVLQLFAGFQLYVQSMVSGHSAIGHGWPAALHLFTDWTQPVFGGLAGVRLVHHAVTYLIAIWVLLHIYYEVWRSVTWQEGDIGISIAGYKHARVAPVAPVAPPGEPRTVDVTTAEHAVEQTARR
jgi:hypothetical protein